VEAWTTLDGKDMTITQERSDKDLKTAVVDELNWVPTVNSANVGVSVSHGTVTLSGEVDTYPEKLMAVKATQRVHGVTAIAQQITVRNAGWGNLNDTDIARNASDALTRAVDVPETVKASVSEHVVTLSGEAWQHERAAAVRSVKYLGGVRDVHDNISLRKTSVAVSAGIKTAIGAALVRNAQIEGGNILVTCDEAGVVTLEGSVRSWDERGQAEYASWAAPGVTGVSDHLRINY
jgi:osmotically-inducible protein OsmY